MVQGVVSHGPFSTKVRCQYFSFIGTPVKASGDKEHAVLLLVDISNNKFLCA